MSEAQTSEWVRLEWSPKFGQIAKALIALQAELTPIGTNAENPHFKAKYATLAAMTKHALPLLAQHQLAITQIPMPDPDPKRVRVVTVLLHPSEQWVRSELSMPLEKATAQGVGSAITYAKRYSFGAMIGLASTEEDDDGQEASKPAAKAKRKQQADRTPTEDPEKVKQRARNALQSAESLKDAKGVRDWIKANHPSLLGQIEADYQKAERRLESAGRQKA